MAGFNALTSPLTFANAQAKWAGFSTPQTAPKAPSAPAAAPAPAQQPAPQQSAPAPSAPAVDPYAQWGGYAGYSKALNDYNSAKNTTYGSITDSINDTGAKFGSSIQDYIDNLTSGQKAIDKAAVQNELARQQGRLGVLDMIGTGIRSGGVMLNNKGATNSSAGEALAQAYNQIGQKQLSGVNNQYETGLGSIQDKQDALNLQTSQFQRHYGEQKTSAINSIVQDASSKLAQLNAAAQNASLSDRIDIEAQKAAIRNQALDALAQYDETLKNGIGGVAPSSAANNQARAMEMLQAGVAPDNAFTYTTVGSPQWQGTGPFASPLAVYAPPRRQDENSSLTSPLGA